MRLEKAYEYFSAYYEGSLDAAMHSQLDRMFEAHSVLRKDFESFAQTMEDLDGSLASDVPVPDNLHDLITARLDRSVYEAERAKPAGFAGFWQKVALGGLAFVLVGGAALSILNRGNSGEIQAGAVPTQINRSADAELRVEADHKGAFLRFHPRSDETVKIVRLPDGAVVQTYKAGPRQSLDVPLNNKTEQAVVLRIVAEPSHKSFTVIIPGSVRKTELQGEGNVIQFAMALSSHFGRPVTLDTETPEAIVRWRLNSENITRSTAAPGDLAVELKNELVRIRY